MRSAFGQTRSAIYQTLRIWSNAARLTNWSNALRIWPNSQIGQMRLTVLLLKLGVLQITNNYCLLPKSRGDMSPSPPTYGSRPMTRACTDRGMHCRLTHRGSGHVTVRTSECNVSLVGDRRLHKEILHLTNIDTLVVQRSRLQPRPVDL